MTLTAPETSSHERPVLLSVEDDPGVARAIARDLRRRYGGTHRVVRAESGPEGLDALRELTVRGERVALLLADHRMPAMTGIEFLEEAMDLAPDAKRVLLTAYADTDAAIRAINEVDLDRYLLKPWDPPEERLYPPLDELLREWAATTRPATEGLTLVGHQWSAQTQLAKEFLARNGIPYRHLDVRVEEARRLLAVARLDDAPDELPVAFLPDGTVLARCTPRDLAERVGLPTTAGSPFYDVVVVGGGPAGLGSAVYAASEGLRTLLVERAATGGQAGQSSRIENYLGFPKGVAGADLAQRARDQALRFGVEIVTTAEVTSLESSGEGRKAHFADGSEVACHAVVLATGVSYTSLPAPGIAEFTGRGVYQGAAAHEAHNCAGQDVYIVGAANSAGQAALFFAKYASRVVIVARGGDLRRSMSEYLVARIEATDNIEVRLCTEVAAAEGEEHLQRLRLRDNRTDTVETVDAEWLFIFIGAKPRTSWLGEAVVRDEKGFLVTGPDLLDAQRRPPAGWPLERDPYLLETSVPGVFAAGDVRATSIKRVASAVGEGALAVSLVHRYLEGL
ncbi:FAD-dependent oxidoreductase [Motilibacter aurantiacus]|uniref:FAD-dependent oxidoreductase n=1 Tax=Motilibacter aurantiacus TaxID=2714955 RepID=UPI00140B1E17|nr:FAD-dependent oxidoreductase [Motilibacter aurantiacus]NHC43667.1 FAD-dependent oxidoreductase [Motilibacter aurantiacus]